MLFLVWRSASCRLGCGDQLSLRCSADRAIGCSGRCSGWGGLGGVAAGLAGCNDIRGARSFALVLFGGVAADAGSLPLSVAFALDDEFERGGLQPVDRGLGQ